MITIQANDISCHRGYEPLFEPVSFTLDNGQCLLISGPNGIGKTTLLQAIAGLSSAQTGSLLFNHEDIDKNRAQWYQKSIYIGHKTGNKTALNCLENLQLYLQVQGIHVTQRQCEDALEQVGLAGYEYQMAGRLSAGQKKRLALSRLLIIDSPIWILDEPFVNLDTAGCEWLLKVVQNHLNKNGLLIITAHDNHDIYDIASQNLILKAAS